MKENTASSWYIDVTAMGIGSDEWLSCIVEDIKLIGLLIQIILCEVIANSKSFRCIVYIDQVFYGLIRTLKRTRFSE